MERVTFRLLSVISTTDKKKMNVFAVACIFGFPSAFNFLHYLDQIFAVVTEMSKANKLQETQFSVTCDFRGFKAPSSTALRGGCKAGWRPC